MATDVSALISTSLTNRHNVAPTYNQPVIRQLGERDGAAQDARHPPSETTSADVPTSPESASTAKPGDLIVQSMRFTPL